MKRDEKVWKYNKNKLKDIKKNMKWYEKRWKEMKRYEKIWNDMKDMKRDENKSKYMKKYGENEKI